VPEHASEPLRPRLEEAPGRARRAGSAPGATGPVPAIDLYDFQIPSNGLGFDHPLTVNSNGYYESLYISPAPDDLVADLALAFLQDDSLRLGRGDAPDMLLLSFSAQDVVSHSYGNESEEELDVLRRLDLHLGRLLAALERLDPARSIVVALSADHGFLVIPEAERKRDKSFVGEGS
jgi:predicted AlkP superfamily pyrophosphatase or phosphodiesterase